MAIAAAHLGLLHPMQLLALSKLCAVSKIPHSVQLMSAEERALAATQAGTSPIRLSACMPDSYGGVAIAQADSEGRHTQTFSVAPPVLVRSLVVANFGCVSLVDTVDETERRLAQAEARCRFRTAMATTLVSEADAAADAVAARVPDESTEDEIAAVSVHAVAVDVLDGGFYSDSNSTAADAAGESMSGSESHAAACAAAALPAEMEAQLMEMIVMTSYAPSGARSLVLPRLNQHMREHLAKLPR